MAMAAMHVWFGSHPHYMPWYGAPLVVVVVVVVVVCIACGCTVGARWRAHFQKRCLAKSQTVPNWTIPNPFGAGRIFIF